MEGFNLHALLRSCARLLVVLIFYTDLNAQDDGQSSYYFKIVSLRGPLSGVYYFPGKGDERVDIQVHAHSKSDFLPLETPSRLTFFRDLEDEHGSLVPTPIASVDFPENERQATIYWLTSGSGANEAHRCFAVGDSIEAFPAGSYRVYNFTQTALAGAIDNEKFKIAPGKNTVVRLNRHALGNINTSFAIERKPGKWKTAYKKVWSWSDRQRVSAFVYPHGSRVKIELLNEDATRFVGKEGGIEKVDITYPKRLIYVFTPGSEVPQMYARQDRSYYSLSSNPEASWARFQYQGPMPIILYRTIEVPGAGGATAYSPFSRLTFENDWTQAGVFLFRQSMGTGQAYQPLVYNFNSDDFRPKTVRVYNFTSKSVTASVSGKEHPIKPGEYIDAIDTLSANVVFSRDGQELARGSVQTSSSERAILCLTQQYRRIAGQAQLEYSTLTYKGL